MQQGVVIRIQPFPAWRYNAEVVRDPAACAGPPYDQFDPAMIARLEAQNTYNVARIVKAPEDGGPDQSGAHYRRADELFREWILERALIADPSPGLYPYVQIYRVGDRQLTRRGFVALGDVRDLELFTHEETHTHVREDRARLRLATAADFGLIFVIYSDPEQSVDRLLGDCVQSTPLSTVHQPDGSIHHLYRCTDTQRTEQVIRSMARRECVIADGHHRTAAARDNWMRKQDERWAWTMMAFFNADAPGMTVLPIHRVVLPGSCLNFEAIRDRLSTWFEVARLTTSDHSPAAVASRMEAAVAERQGAGQIAFALVGPEADQTYLLTARADTTNWLWPESTHLVCRRLPTAAFETGVLRAALGYGDDQIDRGERIDFLKSAVQVIESVRDRRDHLGFILPPTTLDSIFAVARARRNLPQKSTFFFPKLLTGLLVHRIESAAV